MKLQEAASKMHRRAEKSSKACQTLPRGLQLTLFYRKHDIVLRMSRDKVLPSDTEVKICRKAFFGEAELSNCEKKLDGVYIAVERKGVSKPQRANIHTITDFNVEQLKTVGFSDVDCKATEVLVHALQTGHYPQKTYQPIGKPYMIDFAKVTKLYVEYLSKRVSGKADERCPSIEDIKKGILELAKLLQGEEETKC